MELANLSGEGAEPATGGTGAVPGPVAAAHRGDMEFLDKMRGWLVTVAALFVNMAFTAVLHPPDWLNTEWYRLGFKSIYRQLQQGAPTRGEIARSLVFLLTNIGTFATAITLMLALLYVRPLSHAKRIMPLATVMRTVISGSVACTLSVATADNWCVIVVMLAVTAAVCALTVVDTVIAIFGSVCWARLANNAVPNAI